MNYSCLSCRAKYVIPDSRVTDAGVDGLRVRCSRCRAIMAVTLSMAQGQANAASVPVRRVAVPTTPMTTGVMVNPFASVALPDGMAVGGGGGSGDRAVTGIFMPLLSSVEGTKEGTAHFYAAIAGRSRGPYTARELVMLADKGKIRAGTLIWRPGAAGWKPLKRVTEFDVGWLKDAVSRRKRREQEAERTALARRGITPIRLERHTVKGMPALPMDAFGDADWDTALHDSPSAIPHLAGSEISSPFVWQAPTSTAKRAPGRLRERALLATAVVAAAAATAASFFLT